MTEGNFITVKEAAEKLGFTPHYIRKLIREGKILGTKLPWDSILSVDINSLDNYKKTDDFTNDINLLRQPMQISIMEAVEDVEDCFETDVITYFSNIGNISSPISHDDCILIDELLNTLEPKHKWDWKKFKKITLFLHSWWGFLESAIKIVDIIRYYANDFDVIVPMMAKSAATYISLCADTLYMTPISELWPVDPIINSPINPNFQVPARSIDDLVKFYSEAEKKKLNTDDNYERTEVDKMLLDKINNLDPYLLGSYKSALEFSKTEIRSILATKIKDRNLLEQAVEEFTEKYASHSYPITLSRLNKYGLWTILDDITKLSTVKTLTFIYQSFMASNSIIKLLWNRNINRNVIVQTIEKNKQIPTKTAI